jgi:hypothetical protein
MAKAGRPPKLDDRQKSEIGRRLAMGDKAIDLAKEFRVSRALVSTCFSKQTSTIQKLGSDLASVESAVAQLDVSEQVSVRAFADHLRGLSRTLIQAAQSGANVAARLARAAEERIEGKDKDDLLDEIIPVGGLMFTANRASSLGSALVRSSDPATADPTKSPVTKIVIAGRNGSNN